MAFGFTCSRQEETGLLKEMDGGISFLADVKYDFHVIVPSTELDGMIKKIRADSTASIAVAHAKPSYFGNLVTDPLDTDHSNNPGIDFCDPETAAAFIIEIARLQVVDISTGIVDPNLTRIDATVEQVPQ